MSFQERTKIRLTKYKSDNFPELENGQWKKNKKYYSHILPENNKFDNLLPIYRTEFRDYIENHAIKLHSDFHHLNSSQAMCFNFFFPLYHERKLEVLTDFLELKNEIVNYDSVRFEKNGLESKFGRRPTSFDFYFETTTCKKLHFEIKYTEGGFGIANINLDKFDNVYSKFLKPINSTFHSSQQFFANYQILRNLVHIDDNSYVAFVYPKDNKDVCKGAAKVKSDFLIPSFHSHYFSATWENLFDIVSNSIVDNKLKTHFVDFKDKYLPEVVVL